MKRLINLKTITPAISFVLFLLVWIFFAPIQVGGQSYYVIVNGNSMEPLFHKGDLVVLRTANEYAVGDIVDYKYPGIGNVFHRIVGINGGFYQMKGDHNSWVDGYTPVKREIVAKYWFVIKGIGKYLTFLKSPWIIALIAGLFCVIMGSSMIIKSDGKKKKNKQNVAARVSYKLANWRDGYWWTVYAIALAALVLGVFAFTRPLMRTGKDSISYSQKGTFSYNGGVAQAIYDTKEIQTGDPIYTTLSCNIHFLFDYSLESSEGFTGGGTYQVSAILQASNGWKKSFILVPENQFTGNSFHSDASFDTCDLNTIIKNTEAITQVENLQYSLILSPLVQTKGQLAGVVLNESFSPKLTFIVDPLELYLPNNSDPTNDPVHPAVSGNVERSYIETNTLPILGLQLPVATARKIALIVFLLSLIGIVVPMALFSQAAQKDKKLQAKMLIGPMLVETLVSPVSGNERIVDLSSFEDLASLSERSNSTVFFHQQPLFTDYLVRENALVYRFRQMIPLPEGKDQADFQKEIYRALKKDEFILFYQPIYSIQNNKITQVEALLRWQHPEKGLLLAGEFLPQAEKSDLICLIDNWVLQKACQQLREWKESGSLQFNLAINISIQQLRDPNLSKNIQDALLENQLPTDCLSIEISLDQLLFDTVVLNNLKQIRQLGVNVTVKSGDSGAINKLHQLEDVDQLKLSQNLVKQAISDPTSGSATHEIIEEAHRKKVGVTAVGVETSEEMGFFRLNACDGIQGNMLSKPLPSGEFNKIISQKNSAKPEDKGVDA
jgi:signal peptidase I